MGRWQRFGRGLVLTVALIAGTWPGGTAYACSCMEQTPAQALAASQAAFVGRLDSVEPGPAGVFGEPASRWTFEVEAVLAGDLESRVDLLAPEDSGANCGLSVAAGQRVGLVLHAVEGGWSSSGCSTYDADALLAVGEPREPIPADGDATASGGSGPPIGAVATTVAAAVAVLLAAVVLGGRWRQRDGNA